MKDKVTILTTTHFEASAHRISKDYPGNHDRKYMRSIVRHDILPNAKEVTYKIDIKRIINRGAIVGLADGEMFVDDRKIYTAEKLKVGLFKDPSNF